MQVRVLCLLTLSLLVSSLTAQQRQKTKASFFPKELTATRSSGGFNYSLSTSMETYNDLVNPISINNDEVWDDPEYVFPIGFPFQLNGHDLTVMQFAGLGCLALAPTDDPEVITVLLPFEADLIDRGDLTGVSMSPISYTIEGDPGSRIQKIEFKNAGSYEEVFEFGTADMFINFQAWLYEGSNIIEFRFGPHFIDDPETFYFFEPGPLMGVSDLNLFTEEIIQPHFLTGPATKPVLSVVDEYLVGTPPDGMVYRLTPIQPLGLIVTGTNSTSICNPNGSAAASASGGTPPYTYLWSNGSTSDTIQNLGAGTYTVTVTDSDGATSNGTVTITQPDDLISNITSTDETAPDANDGTATVAPEGGLSPYTVEWSTGETSLTITGLAPGTYSVTITDDAGCTIIAATVINAAECLELEIESAVTSPTCAGLCNGAIEILAVNGGTEPFSYAWSNGETTPNISVCAGSYGVTILDANNCVIAATYMVTEPDPLQANASSTDESFFQGNDGTATAAPSGGTPPYLYAWSNGSPESSIDSLAPGFYTVTVVDSQGCLDSQEVEVLPYVCPGTVSFQVFDPSCAGICDGIASAGINGVPGIGYSYSWSNGAATQGIDNLCAGEFIVTITGLDNCVYIDTVQLIEPAPLVVVVDSITHFHDTTAASISITASGGVAPYTYLWTGANGFTSTLEDIAGFPPGFYSVVVTDVNGCTTTLDSIEVLDLNTSIDDPFASGVRLYPNPVHHELQIDLGDGRPFEVRLFSASGIQLRHWVNTHRLKLDDLTPGAYLIHLESGTSHWTGWIIRQ